MKGGYFVEFKDYAQGLKPYFSFGKNDADFFVDMIGNFIKDSVMDNCKILDNMPDTQARYINGNSISKKNALFLFENRDIDKYIQWVHECIEKSDSYTDICEWLQNNGLTGSAPDIECYELLASIFLSITKKSKAKKKTSSPFEESLNLIKDINTKVASLPRPIFVQVPDIASPIESPYIQELYAAYGDAEAVKNFSNKDLPHYPDYEDDLNDRRIDFYAAVSIERSLLELDADNLSNQFDVLKEETLDGVKDTNRKKYANGYEKMLSVMEQASTLQYRNYLLSQSPYWISNKIQKGVCHHLVNDGKLRWVK